MASGSPFPPATVGKETFVVAQANNALVFPGLGLGAIVARASRITSGMLRAAARAVAKEIDATRPGAPLLPPFDTLRQTSTAVAAAVARAAVEDGVARQYGGTFDDAVAAAMWEPAYRPLRPLN